jgi:EmrB/QacA subfamily drug resistance transporter
MEVVVPSSGPTAAGPAPGGRWALPLVVLVVGMFATVLDTTIVNVAIPSIQKDIGASADDVEWIVTAYTLALGMVVPLCGWLGDRIGLSRLYALALLGFAVTSAMCGLAWDLPSLVAFRILQAIPGGVLPVISLTMLYRIVPPAKIGSAMGMYGLGVVVAPAIGPTLGGWLLEHTTWPVIFFINLPIGILGAIAAMLVFPRIRPTSWPRFDFWGFITIAYGLFAILLASSEGQDWGWTGYRVLMLFTSGALSLALFVVIELQVETPLLDVRVFRSWSYTNSLLLIVVVSIGLNAVLFYLPQFMQEGQGLTALNAGLTLLPEAFALVIMMPIAGKLYDMFGARWPAVAGLAISAYGTYLLTDLSPATTRMEIMVWTSLRAFGVALAMMPIMTAGLSALPPESTGAGSAWSNVGQRVAGSLGLAGFGALVSSQQNQLMADRSSLLTSGDAGSVPGLRQILDQGASGLYGLYVQLQAQVLASAYADVFLVATLLTAAVIVLGLMLPSKARPGVATPEPASTEVVATEFSESAEAVDPTVAAAPDPAEHRREAERRHAAEQEPVGAGSGSR